MKPWKSLVSLPIPFLLFHALPKLLLLYSLTYSDHGEIKPILFSSFGGQWWTIPLFQSGMSIRITNFSLANIDHKSYIIKEAVSFPPELKVLRKRV